MISHNTYVIPILFHPIRPIEACHESPCNNGATCVPLKEDEVVPQYEQPAWIHPSWMPRYFAARQVQDELQPETWDGRQKGSPTRVKRMARGKTTPHAKAYLASKPVHRVKSQSRSSSIPMYMRLLMPKALQKKRPFYKVNYKCICAYGFTGYNCQSLFL